MNQAPIPLIAYFFITVTAGTLAYATFTDIGGEPVIMDKEPIVEETQPGEYVTNTKEEVPSVVIAEPAQESPSENKPLISLSNPFSNQPNPTQQNTPPVQDVQQEGVLNSLGIGRQAGGETKKNGHNRKRRHRKSKKRRRKIDN
jgi:hypothetical protein|uniref:Uncharacterized protein n=1 Tax=viral metagenome TaxID=1070528 RepID=A0A6C0IP08_9ZZZZ